MEKMSCDIIQDLIPSYLDGVCSTATKNCVEEHIKDCTECKEIVASCQNNTLTGNQTELKVLDGLRKTKKKMHYLFYGNIALVIVVFFGMQEFLIHTNALLLSFFALFSVSMCVNLFIHAAAHTKYRPEKIDYVICTLSVILMLCPALLFYYVMKKSMTATGSIFFGIEAAQCGPLLDKLFLLAFVIQLVCFLYFLFRTNKRGKNCILLSCPALAGIFLMMSYRALLGRLDTPESFFAIFIQLHIISIIIAVLGILISMILMFPRKMA